MLGKALISTILFALVLQAATQNRPNIILLLTDDQDILLGSMEVMEKTEKNVVNAGASFRNAFVTTPICCPSRSSILTGLYSHNHNVLTNNDNCSSPLWQRTHENGTFATYLQRGGYETGYFGKYLNEYNGSYTPPGWEYWMGLIRNSKYYNYTLLHNGVREPHGDDYAADYLTDLVANVSMDHFRNSKRANPDKPILSVLSFPAPHGPEDGAPQYQDLYKNVTSHETASFNYAPNPDKNWLLRKIGGVQMDDKQKHFSTMLQQKRLQTLRSVDDNVKRFVDMLEDIGQLDNTYIIYMSDHGYHIGQFGIPKGKALPYDFDTRIPFYFRGPGIAPGLSIDNIVLNVDVAPTILDLAGIEVPPSMDGTSIMRLFRREMNSNVADEHWRDRFLIQRGKLPRVRTTLQKPRPPNKLSKTERLAQLCGLPNYAYPCTSDQHWTCQTNGTEGESSRIRIQKCHREKKKPVRKAKKCHCKANQRPDYQEDEEWLDIKKSCGGRKRNNRKYKRRHVLLEDKKRQRARLLRYRRSAPNRNGKIGYGKAVRRASILTPMCRLYMPNFDIKCRRDIYDDYESWVRHMGQLAKDIQTLQSKLKRMKILRTRLVDCDGSSRLKTIQRRQTPLCVCPEKTKPKTRNQQQHPSVVENDHPWGHEQEQVSTQRLRYQAELSTYKNLKQQNKLLNEQRKEKKAKKALKNSPRLKKCDKDPGLNCFKLNENTWKTNPRWDGEEECYCTQSFNNTYWCLRILNDDMNLMYCHFYKSEFVEFYDLQQDPDQLYSSANELKTYERDWLHSELMRMRRCAGSAMCNAIGSDPPANASFLFQNQVHPSLDQNFEAKNTNETEVQSLNTPVFETVDFDISDPVSREHEEASKEARKSQRKDRRKKSRKSRTRNRGKQPSTKKTEILSKRKRKNPPKTTIWAAPEAGFRVPQNEETTSFRQ